MMGLIVKRFKKLSEAFDTPRSVWPNRACAYGPYLHRPVVRQLYACRAT